MRAATLLFVLLAFGAWIGQRACPASTPQGDAAPKPQEVKKTDADPAMIRELIKQLGDESFKKREAAQERLAKIGPAALEFLQKALKDETDLEVQVRVKELVRAIDRSFFVLARNYEGHGGGQFPWTTRLALTPDGKQVISAGFDGLRVWEIDTGKQLNAFGQFGGTYWSLTVSPDGNRIFAGGDKNVAKIFDLKSGKKLADLTGHTGSVWGAAFLDGGKKLITGGWDQTLRVWDVQTGKELRQFDGVRGKVRCLAVSPDGKWVVSCHFPDWDQAGTVRVWDLEMGTEVRTLEGHQLEVSCVAFSPDGKSILSAGFDKSIRLWDAATGKLLRQFVGHTGRVEYAAFTADGKRVWSCGNESNPTVRIWEVESGKQVHESQDVQGGLTCVVLLPDGLRGLTTGKDGGVRLWQLAK
jgi:WD40 repeat protein